MVGLYSFLSGDRSFSFAWNAPVICGFLFSRLEGAKFGLVEKN
jgi:hypothetical protein